MSLEIVHLRSKELSKQLHISQVCRKMRQTQPLGQKTVKKIYSGRNSRSSVRTTLFNYGTSLDRICCRSGLFSTKI